MKSKHFLLIIISLLLFVLTACTNSTTTTPKGVTLPDLSGRTKENYTEILNSDLITIVDKEEFSDTIPNGVFIRYGNNKKAGDFVSVGTLLNVYFSKGPQKVPDTEKPVINGVPDISVPFASEFNPLAGVTITDNVDQDLMTRLTVSGTINTWDLSFSTQIIRYTVMDRGGNLTVVERKITIIPNEIDTRYTDALKLDREYLGKSYVNDGIGEVTFSGCIDGDTAYFMHNSERLYVRFLGIDTPESTRTIDPWGKAASEFTCNILKNADTIVLEHEGQLKDNYDRYLAWVWVDGRLLNLEIVENAYSAAKGSSGSKYNDIFNEADLKTQGTKRRIWGELDPDFNYN